MDGLATVSWLGAILIVGVTLLLSACGGESEPTPTDAARNLMQVYEDAGVTVPEAEGTCANEKVLGVLSEADASATKLTDLSMDGRGRVAAAVEECFSSASLKQVFEKTVATDAGLTPQASACLAKALIDQRISYAGLMRQSKNAVAKLGNAARKCVRTTGT